MKHVSKNLAEQFSNSDICSGIEYNFDDSTMNGALITINGRYPKVGYVMNEICKELASVVRGEGAVCKSDQTMKFQAGDTLFIDKKEKFYWSGDFDIYTVCTPSFDPEQHKEIIE